MFEVKFQGHTGGWASKAGGGGTRPPVEKSAGDVPPEMKIFHELFLTRIKILHFSTFSK